MRRLYIAIVCLCLLAGCASPGTECRLDADCPAGSYCLPTSGECIFDCTVDGECPTGYRCSSRGRCEPGCVRTNGGLEACDGVDNDCDGDTDEAFPELGQSCHNGGCPAGAWVCAPGGQGVSCDGPLPAADDASCDGLDSDCDGDTDEDAVPRACPLQEGVCAGSTQACGAGGVWSECDYGPHYTADVDATCDGRDDDCDGATDEDGAFTYLPESGSEASDGRDNNCNGAVDEPGLMVAVPWVSGVWIDVYEATLFELAGCAGVRYGEAADDYPAGFPAAGAATVELYACSLPGLVPSGYLSWHRANRACVAAGKRLCRQQEWATGCGGADQLLFPYGVEMSNGACNDGLGGSGAPAPGGAYPACVSPTGTYDMSGNLTEWIQEVDPEHPQFNVTTGGSYLCQMCQFGADCLPCDPDTSEGLRDISRMHDCLPSFKEWEEYTSETALPFLGARCCWDGP